MARVAPDWRTRFDGVAERVLLSATPLLHQLNQVVASSGERIEGGLVMENDVRIDGSSSPHARGAQKRDLFVGLARVGTRMLEVGFNAGHSAALALTANPTLEYEGFDLCAHNYTARCYDLLAHRFPGRVSLTCGDSVVRLRRQEFRLWMNRSRRYDRETPDSCASCCLRCGSFLA
jgi:hypothetical protein|uniref:Uncharacterized protein n=1 Tax=Haptolina ericina TaxID=156174 RepID=A0A7S3BNT3_9EUKA|mmetsp:Transcript_64186/g.143451  ORF Transcript_64186/g.143451 Transcript_64186/m.143451 type:complete len:176 (+) Transcript_64186:55-582(+)